MTYEIVADDIILFPDHLIAPVLAHAFCNHMGFPDVREIMAHSMPQRAYIGAAFVGGLAVWLLLLIPMTAPWLYSNDLYYV
jgi:prenyl protein peptidase